MLRFRHTLFACLLAAGSVALAQTKAASKAKSTQQPVQWASEVTSLRGVEIGSKLADFPECPKKGDGRTYWDYFDKSYPAEFTDKVCWKESRDKSFLKSATAAIISNLPFIKGLGREVAVTVINGAIEAIEMGMYGADRATTRDAMLEKFGTPTERSIREYRNQRGLNFRGDSITWSGKQVTLTFSEYDGHVDKGQAMMRSRVFDAAVESQIGFAKDSIKTGL